MFITCTPISELPSNISAMGETASIIHCVRMTVHSVAFCRLTNNDASGDFDEIHSVFFVASYFSFYLFFHLGF